MAVLDHYAALGVARDADPEVIRAAYRALAKKYHPDSSSEKSSESLRRFRQICEAHSVLSDFVQRAEYDTSLRSASLAREASTGRPHPSYADAMQAPPPASAKRSSLEKVRNGVVVVGWSLMGGFIILLVLAVILALIFQLVHG